MLLLQRLVIDLAEIAKPATSSEIAKPTTSSTYLSEFTQRALDLKLNLAFETFAGANFSAA
jgi:hypothetical protein